MHWGVEMARKGGVPPDRVLNAMPLAKASSSSSAQAADREPCGLACDGEKGRIRQTERRTSPLPAVTATASKFCSAIPAGPSGATRTLASWSIPKGLIAEAKLPSPQRSANLRKRRVTGRAARPCRLARQSSREESLFTSGPSKTTGMPARSRAICSKWNGRHDPGAGSRFPNLTAPHGLTSLRRTAKILKGQAVFLNRLLAALKIFIVRCAEPARFLALAR